MSDVILPAPAPLALHLCVSRARASPGARLLFTLYVQIRRDTRPGPRVTSCFRMNTKRRRPRATLFRQTGRERRSRCQSAAESFFFYAATPPTRISLPRWEIGYWRASGLMNFFREEVN